MKATNILDGYIEAGEDMFGKFTAKAEQTLLLAIGDALREFKAARPLPTDDPENWRRILRERDELLVVRDRLARAHVQFTAEIRELKDQCSLLSKEKAQLEHRYKMVMEGLDE